jgi:hypothetical protein
MNSVQKELIINTKKEVIMVDVYKQLMIMGSTKEAIKIGEQKFDNDEEGNDNGGCAEGADYDDNKIECIQKKLK